jgi:hypothetical protein
LTDIGVHVLADRRPFLSVRPEAECFGPDGLVSDARVPVTVEPGGVFNMQLIPSHELRALRGSVGVRYVLELALFDRTVSGADWFSGANQWLFTARPGGGPVAGMGEALPIDLYIGPPWPAAGTPGVYFDVTTDDVGYCEIGTGI